MDLPVMPPVAPMLAKPVGELPEGAWSLEPKWGGFWTIVCCDGDEVELGSGRERPLTRSFPEVVEAVRAELPPRCGVDAEIVVLTPTAGGSTSTRCCCAATPAAGRVRLWLSRFRLDVFQQGDYLADATVAARGHDYVQPGLVLVSDAVVTATDGLQAIR